MRYAIEQSETYLGNDRWEWAVWIQATPANLKQLVEVTWILHPTFSPSTITVRDHEAHFRLDTSGWGTFLLHAKLQPRHGSPFELSHMLKLSYPAGAQGDPAHRGESASSRSDLAKPRIFLSYSSEDERNAQLIQQLAEAQGAQVVNSHSIASGMPMEAGIRKLIRESDAVLNFSGTDYVGPWIVKESNFAKVEGKPVYTLDLSSVSIGAGGLETDTENLMHQMSELVQNLSGQVKG